MNKSLYLLILILIFVFPVSAAYLTNLPKTLTQPDGRSYNCFASGDEYYNWLHDAAGYTIIRNPQTGYYTYATKQGDTIVPSAYIVGDISPLDTGIPKGVNIDPETHRRLRQQRWAEIDRSLRSPSTGVVNNLVIFIRFSDEVEFSGNLSTYTSMFNDNTPNTNSMYNYFQEDSYQALQLTTAFYPSTSNDNIVSYQDSHPRSYYEPYSTMNPNGYDGDNERESREMTLLQSAVNFVASQIPVSLDLDADDDGRIDNVCFIVKGTTGEWADLLWPHMWVMQNTVAMINGARVYTFNFQLEDALSYSGVGVLCHEMSHSMGFPDLYHYSYDGISTVGSWDLMESNQNPPQHHCAYMKSRYGNWLPPMQELTQSGTYYVNKMLNRERNCYKIASNNPQYFYVVEFRKKQGLFENSLSGTGLLVYRVNSSMDGIGNADGPPDELYLYRRNGTQTQNGQTNNATFSLEVNRRAINESTNPTPFLGDGTQGGLNITLVGSSAGDSIGFHLEMPIPPPNDYDEGFETGNFNSNNWSFEANADWVIDSSNAFSGLSCAKSGAINNNQTSSMLLIADVPSDGNIGFVKKVSSEQGYDYLKFFIDGVQIAQWSGISNWTYAQFPVTLGTHIFKWSYVKDQGTVSGSDCAWIDNISFHWDAPEVFLPPQSFTVEPVLEDVGVVLSWQAPPFTTGTLSGYRIFKNDIQIADLDSTNLIFFDYNVVPYQTYSYYVKTLYSSPLGHSVSTEAITATISGFALIPNLISAEIVDTNSVHLHWNLPMPDRAPIGYRIYRNGALIHSIDSLNVSDWIDYNLQNGQYSYQIAAQYHAFTGDLSSPLQVIINVVVANDDLTDALPVFGIKQCFPNPFSRETTISYSVDKDNLPYELSIYNIKGQKVITILNGKSKAGKYTFSWNSRNDKGEYVAAGIYYCRLCAYNRIATQKLVLLK